MKKLFTFALLACISMFASAQPWNEGEEITDQVDWSNLSFTNETISPWVWTGQNGSTTQTGGTFELYNGWDAELYQVIYLPAGMYEVTCQGYYRGGTSWDDDPNTWAGTGANSWEDRAWLIASTGEYDLESAVFTEGKTFKTPLMPRLFEEQYTQIYAADSATTAQMGWDPSDGNYAQCGNKWGPTSVPGSLLWFQAGLYQPYNDGDGTKYNTTTFFLKEAGYVKLGIKKGEAHADDSFMATNFKLYYQGEPDEVVLAVEELDVEIGNALNLTDKIRDAGFGSLAAFLDDIIMELDYDESDVESVNAAIEVIKQAIEQFTEYLNDANALAKLVKNCENLANSSNYAGHDDFVTAIEAAKFVAEDQDMMIDGPEAYAEAVSALRAARVAYMMSDGKVDGKYNFSGLINFPFFCNNEYTPQWNAEKGYYEYIPEIEETWVNNIQEQGVKDVMNEHPDWINLASDVTWTQKQDAVGEWIYNYQIQGWMGGIDNVTMQHGYTAVGAWSGGPQGGYQEMRQVITDLPDGYYSMGALFINAGEACAENQYVFICPGAQTDDATMEKAQFTHVGQHWWWGAGNWPLYRTDDWQSLKTNMVKVEGGKVVIGSRSNAFYAVTGFQLYYYGEDPDYTGMLMTEYDAAKANAAEKLTWGGDTLAVNEMFNSIVFPIADYDAYAAALAVLNQINNYVNTASAVISNFEANTINSYLMSMEEKAENETEVAMLEQGLNFVLDLGTGANDTYFDAQAAMDVYAEYMAYLRTYEKALTYNTEAIQAVLARHEADLTANYAGSAEKLQAYQKELAGPINEAIFNERGAETASEENPMDITDLIVNASLAEGPATGWTCEGATPTMNEFGREMAEIWNTDVFDIYQIIRDLPAGKYQLKAHALYRDGGDVGSTTGGPYYNWNIAGGKTFEGWNNKNCQLYANSAYSYVPSVASEYFTEPSFVGSFKIEGEGYTVGNGGAFLFFDELQGDDINDYYDPETGEIYYMDMINMDAPGYPYDYRIIDGENTYYYPQSMAGAYRRFKDNPESYCVSTTLNLTATGDIRLGLRKTAAVGGDWLIYDDIQLFYLGEADALAGDANTDGEVNVSDIAAVANYILGEEVDPFDAVAADCDASGEIDVTDISGIAQIILTAEPTEGKVKTILAAAEGSATLTLSADEVVAGQEFTLNVDLNNADDAICGVQADIYLPEGLEFVLDEYDEPTVEGGRSSKITTECALQGNGALRILCYSAKNYTYSGTEGAVATIAVKAADTFTAGDIVMKKIVLSSYNNKKVAQIKPADFTLPVSTGADAISGINATTANGAMFNLAGQSVDNSFRGVVIMNGKKVLVK